jgi:hypothetical protein
MGYNAEVGIEPYLSRKGRSHLWRKMFFLQVVLAASGLDVPYA